MMDSNSMNSSMKSSRDKSIELSAERSAERSADPLQGMMKAFCDEPYAGKMGLRLLEIGPGRAVVEMEVLPEHVNFFGSAHGGAIFAVADGAFGAAANSRGTLSVALNVNVSYVAPAMAGDILRAEAVEASRSGRISTFRISVTNDRGPVSIIQAMAYNKKDPLPFMKP